MLGLLALAVIVLLNERDLPGIGAAVIDWPAALAISAAVHVPQIVLTALAWRALLAPTIRPSVRTMVLLRWFREAAGAVLPAGGLVGQAAAARLLVRCRVPIDVAAASATVDLTLEAASQLLFTLAGFALLLAGEPPGDPVRVAAVGVGITAGSAGAMIALQRRLPLTWLKAGLCRLARRWPSLRPEVIEDFQRSVRRLHAEGRRLTAAMLWHGAAWLLGAVEIVAILGLVGRPVTWTDALIIESLAQALRNAGFMFPGAVGVNEAAIVGAAALVGIPPSAALAAAIVRRMREVLFSLPALVAWQRSESGKARGTAAVRASPTAGAGQ